MTGSVIGAIFGDTIADIASRGGRKTYYDERVWEDGRVIRDEIREVCDDQRYEQGY